MTITRSSTPTIEINKAEGDRVDLDVVARQLGLSVRTRGRTITLSNGTLCEASFPAGKTAGDTTLDFVEAVLKLRHQQADILTERFQDSSITWRLYADDWGHSSTDDEAWEGGFEAEGPNGDVVNRDGYLPFGLDIPELVEYTLKLVQ